MFSKLGKHSKKIGLLQPKCVVTERSLGVLISPGPPELMVQRVQATVNARAKCPSADSPRPGGDVTYSLNRP